MIWLMGCGQDGVGEGAQADKEQRWSVMNRMETRMMRPGLPVRVQQHQHVQKPMQSVLAEAETDCCLLAGHNDVRNTAKRCSMS